MKKELTPKEYAIFLGIPTRYLSDWVLEERMYKLKYLFNKNSSQEILLNIIRRTHKDVWSLLPERF